MHIVCQDLFCQNKYREPNFHKHITIY